MWYFPLASRNLNQNPNLCPSAPSHPPLHALHSDSFLSAYLIYTVLLVYDFAVSYHAIFVE